MIWKLRNGSDSKNCLGRYCFYFDEGMDVNFGLRKDVGNHVEILYESCCYAGKDTICCGEEGCFLIISEIGDYPVCCEKYCPLASGGGKRSWVEEIGYLAQNIVSKDKFIDMLIKAIENV